ncbi:MAG: arginine--tRNA ligase, partial [Caulobacteraceae bacterium]
MSDLRTALGEAVGAAFAEAGLSSEYGRVTPSDRPDLADFQCNGALAAAKAAKSNPRAIAETIAARLRQSALIGTAEIAGPGFINLTLKDTALEARLQHLASAPDSALPGTGAGKR